jgi:hypothetical protein
LSRDSWAGWAVDTGDLDGDGYADIAAGAPGTEDSRGWVLIWDGADVAQRGDVFADYRLRGSSSGDRFGHRVLVEDLDQDGLKDLVVGAPRQAQEGATEVDVLGSIMIFRGAESWAGWRPQMDVDRASQVQFSDWNGSEGPLEMISGDIDGDETTELLVLELQQSDTGED